MPSLPLPFVALLTLAACAPIAAQDPPPQDPTPAGPEQATAACNAEAAQSFVGRMPGDATVRAAQTASGADSVRVIPHDGMVTLDYREDRLNLQLDESGRIAVVSCG
jgi:hypothetical protein